MVNFVKPPDKHLHEQGCPKCRSSRGESSIQKWLENHNIEYETQKIFSDLRNPKTKWLLKYDFYIPHKNLLIEFDGKQHFECVRIKGKHLTTKKELLQTQYLDKIKTMYAKKKSICLLRISYNQANKIDSILSRTLF